MCAVIVQQSLTLPFGLAICQCNGESALHKSTCSYNPLGHLMGQFNFLVTSKELASAVDVWQHCRLDIATLRLLP